MSNSGETTQFLQAVLDGKVPATHEGLDQLRKSSLPPDRVSIPYDQAIKLKDLAAKLGGGITLWDSTMNTTIQSETGSFKLTSGQWVAVDNGNFYQIVTEENSAAAVRAHVRPQHWLAKGDEDFVVTIQNGRTDDGTWICDSDSDSERIVLKREMGKLFYKEREITEVDGDVGIFLGEELDEAALLVQHEDGSCELINNEVFMARAKARLETPVAETVNWNKKPSEFLQGAGEEAKVLLGTIFSWNLRDVVSLISIGLAELGGPWGTAASIVLMGSNLIEMVWKSGKTKSQIRNEIKALLASQNSEELMSKFNLSAEEISKGKNLARLAYRRQTALGKLLAKDVIDLSRTEKNWALAIGVGGTAVMMGMSRIISSLLPGRSITSLFINRFLLRYFLPRMAVYGGHFVHELELEFSPDKDSAAERAKEWTQLTLGAMSATITVMATAGFSLNVGSVGVANWENIQEMLHVKPTVTVETTRIPSPTVTPSPIGTGKSTHATEPATVTPIPATETPSATPTETSPPTPKFSWQPGEPINDALLDQAKAAGHLLDIQQGIHINLFGQNFELFRFDLDQKTDDYVPEVWAVKDQQGDWHPVIWEDKGGQFAVDIDGNGLPNGWLPESELPRELLPDGRGGGGEAPRLDLALRDYDLDNDGKQDIIPQINPQNGKEEFWIDRDSNSIISSGDEKVFISWTTNAAGTHIVDNIEFEDKSYWQLVDKEKQDYEGYVLKNHHYVKLTLNEAVGGETAVRQKVLIGQYHQLYSPEQIGRQAWLNPGSVTMPAPVVVVAPVVPPADEIPVEQPHGEPVGEGQNEVLVQSNGQRLILGPDGGAQGMLQQEIHVNNPDLDPDALGVVAHRVALTNDPSVSIINQQTAIVSVERWLESNQGWLANNGHPWETLSDREKYMIGKMFMVNHPIPESVNFFVGGGAGSDFLKALFNWDDDEEIKRGILQVINQAEVKND